jgi:hypothetical protein
VPLNDYDQNRGADRPIRYHVGRTSAANPPWSHWSAAAELSFTLHFLR